MRLRVAIVGRPNVGKSALFNRIAGKGASIVHRTEGVTRDRLYTDCVWQGREFTLIDTGGFDLSHESEMSHAIRLQIERAMDEADVLVFVVDARDGLTPQDSEIADILRKKGKVVLVAANKCESLNEEHKALEFSALGFEKIFPISALHGLGIGELLDEIVCYARDTDQRETSENSLNDAVKIAIVGKPNVGKSSLVNVILGEERMTVSDIPGTTVDAVDTLFRLGDKSYVFIDTAGLRRPARIEEKLEEMAVGRALAAIKRSQVVLLMLDGSDKPSAQDRRIAGYIQRKGKASIIVVNKTDLGLYEDLSPRDYQSLVLYQLRPIWYSPVVFTSVRLKKGIDKILPQVDEVFKEYSKRIETSILNQAMLEITDTRKPPRGSRFFYATQVDERPPRFVFFVKNPENIPEPYMRYIEGELRTRFGFKGTPLVLELRSRDRDS